MMNHPSSKELLDALLQPDDAAEVQNHTDECLACRVRQARLAQAGHPQPPDSNSVRRIVEASTVVPGLLNLGTVTESLEPTLGELWRIGRDEALLVWVRNNFGDGVVDVIPAVLDVELADEQTVIVAGSKSTLQVDLGVMVALRTHVHRDAFINRVDVLDISAHVEEVIAATREGRESVAPVGPRIEHDDDDRLEYRQALRDLLAELSPTGWAAELDRGHLRYVTGKSTEIQSHSLLESEVRELISDRLWTARCLTLRHEQFPFGSGLEVVTAFKVVYLDTAVMVLQVPSLDDAVMDLTELVDACQRAAASSPDADAVCVAEAIDEWPCLLFSRASMRNALELPEGMLAGPVPIFTGLGIVDTLWKHLEGAAPAWGVTERPPREIGIVDVSALAGRHAQTSIADIEAQGRRAHQAAKKSSWSALPSGLSDRVTRFVAAVIQSTPAEEAFAELSRESL